MGDEERVVEYTDNPHLVEMVAVDVVEVLVK